MKVYETLNVLKQKQAFVEMLDAQNQIAKTQKAMFDKACTDLQEIAQILNLHTKKDSLRQMTSKIKRKLKTIPKTAPKMRVRKQDSAKLQEFENRAQKPLAKWAQYDLEREIKAYYIELLGIEKQDGAMQEVQILRSILQLVSKAAKNA